MGPIFWDVTLRSIVEVYQCFGETYCIRLQGRNMHTEQQGISKEVVLILKSQAGEWILIRTFDEMGHELAQLLEELCYKPEGRGLESQRGGFFQFT
jgi:hypothetical protein